MLAYRHLGNNELGVVCTEGIEIPNDRFIDLFKIIMEGLVKNIIKNVMVELRFFHRREDKIDER